MERTVKSFRLGIIICQYCENLNEFLMDIVLDLLTEFEKMDIAISLFIHIANRPVSRAGILPPRRTGRVFIHFLTTVSHLKQQLRIGREGPHVPGHQGLGVVRGGAQALHGSQHVVALVDRLG